MDFDNLGALIAFAIEKEKEAADFYEENSEAEMMSGKRQMLKEFAAEERKHQRMLEDYLATGIAEKIEEYRFEWITDIKRSDYVDAIEYKPGMAYNEILAIQYREKEDPYGRYSISNSTPLCLCVTSVNLYVLNSSSEVPRLPSAPACTGPFIDKNLFPHCVLYISTLILKVLFLKR